MSIGREDYQERKEARIDRYEQRAANAQAESDSAYKAAHEIMRHIPPGQPILVGHHSERRHRRDLEKIDRQMHKSFEADERAAYYADRAASAASNTAISSDDPDAVEKLEEKLAALQAQQERDKAMNAYYRKYKTMKGFPDMDDERAAKINAALAKQDANPHSSGKHPPVPAYVLSNRNGEIKHIKDRLAQLRKVDEMKHTEIEFDGGTIITNEEVNRVQILFDEKPDETTRSKLKGNGFRWSPREQAWQAQRTPAYLRRACHILDVELSTKPIYCGESDTAPQTVPLTPSSDEEKTGEIRTSPDGQVLLPLA